MSSRKKRKRDRRRAEATAQGPILRGGWGRGSEIRPRDLLLIRQAIREGWETPPDVGAAIIRDVVSSALDAKKPRLSLAAVRVCIDAVKDQHGGFDAFRRRQRRQWPA
jgi:hypothetical protein